MHQTHVLHRLVSTGHGQRRILKKSPPIIKYIRQAIESGTYPPADDEPYDDEKARSRFAEKRFKKLPIEYEILSLHPPIPPPPRIPSKLRAKRNRSINDAMPTNKFMKDYLKRQEKHEQQTVEEYYNSLLGIPPPTSSTIMGKKSALLNKAYAFAIKQQEVLRSDGDLTEEESIAIVEDLLAKSKKEERFTSRSTANQVHEWRQQQDSKDEPSDEEQEHEAISFPDPNQHQETVEDDHAWAEVKKTTPSVMHSKPRAIEGMTLWSQRLKAVPYREWTLGATVALDHWIARSILDLEEDTWQELLEGTNPSLQSHGRDIITVRKSLFPETVLDGPRIEEEEEEAFMAEQQEEEDDLSEDKSIDELLASLGGFESDSSSPYWPSESDSTEQADTDLDAKVAKLVDELQRWRAKNVQTPYDEWSSSDKEQFTSWLNNYVTTLASKEEGQVDMVATRKALLASPPVDKDESDKFWNQVRDETEAEILLQAMRKKGATDAATEPQEGETPSERKAREAFAAFQHLPYDVQLEKLANLGALRPILDEYTAESDRLKFLARYGDKLMEGVEMEHLVPDPTGPIRGEELGKWGEENGIDKDERFRLKLVPYGTDGFGLGQDVKTRAMYNAWNMQKAGRARFEETMFKTGRMGLRYNLKKK